MPFIKGQKFTEEHKAKLALTKIGKKRPAFSLNHRKNISESAKKSKLHYRFGVGKDNFKWIFDRTLLVKKQERNDSAYGNWRIEVYKRDNYKCKISNTDCKGRIEAHHILGWAEHPTLRYEINNGITLCHFHHPKMRKEEKRLSPYFQELVSVSN